MLAVSLRGDDVRLVVGDAASERRGVVHLGQVALAVRRRGRDAGEGDYEIREC
jgi:hypothetical protein